jgi:hypothetical protein
MHWKNAFENAANAMGISVTDAAYTHMIGHSSPMGGRSHAVADGQSSQPFDGVVHGNRSAVQRHDDTAGMSPTDIWTIHLSPIGTVTVDQYRGQDWSPMPREEVVAAMRVRARLVIDGIRADIARSTSLQDKITRTPAVSGGFESVDRAHAFLKKVYYHVMKLAS